VSVDPRLLRSFVALGEELHFGRAAARLHIAQPALSQQIQRLERQLDAVLVERDSRNVSLTAAGLVLFESAREVIGLTDQAIRDVRDLARRPQVVLLCEIDAQLALAEAVAAFHASAPATDIVPFYYTDARQLAMAAGWRGVDAIITWGDPVPDFDGGPAPLSVEELVIVVREDHPLAGAQAPTLDDFSRHRLWMFPREPGPEAYDALLGHMTADGHGPSIRVLQAATIGVSQQAFMTAVLTDGGMAFCTRRYFSAVAPRGLVALPIDPPLTQTVVIQWRGTPNKALQAFLASLPGS